MENTPIYKSKQTIFGSTYLHLVLQKLSMHSVCFLEEICTCGRTRVFSSCLQLVTDYKTRFQTGQYCHVMPQFLTVGVKQIHSASHVSVELTVHYDCILQHNAIIHKAASPQIFFLKQVFTNGMHQFDIIRPVSAYCPAK